MPAPPSCCAGLDRRFSLLCSAVAALGLLSAFPAYARVDDDRLERIETRLDEQNRRLEAQARQIDTQRRVIEAQRRALEALRTPPRASLPQSLLEDLRAGALAVPRESAPQPRSPIRQAQTPPVAPVGEAPAAPTSEQQASEVAALPEGVGVLTPPGVFVFEPSFEYVRSTANRLVFRGVEIVPGVNLGVIEANDADRDTLVGAATLRLGVTRRIEIEGRLPYVYRSDRITTVAQRDATVTRILRLDARAVGDAEFTLRAQINRGVGPGPIFLGNLRVKTDTGRGPYDVPFDEFGVALGLATGSGFWSVEPSVTMLLPSEPAVIFATLGYLHNFARRIDRSVGGARIGRVDPGDSIGAGIGFGFALNPRFSFSLGYSHNAIFATKSEIGATRQRARSLQVGALQFGWSYRLTDNFSLNNNVELGATRDAPDLRVIVRTPFRF
jgi:hypothetical protein